MNFDQYLPESVRERYSLKLFGVSLAIVLLIVAFSIFVGLQVSERVTEEQLDSLEANAELEAEALGEWIDGERQSVRLLSNHRGLASPTRERARATLIEERGEMPPEVAHLSLVDRTPSRFSEGRNETILASTNPALEGEPLSATSIDWNPDIGYNFADEDEVVLSWVYLDGEAPSVALASPTADGDHVVVAEYRTNVRAESFTSVVDETDTVVLGGFTAFVLFDDNRTNVMTRYEGDRRNSTIGSLILDSDPFETLSGSVLTEDEVKGYHSVPGETVDWVVVKEAPRSSALSLTRAVRSDLVILIGMLFVGFVLIGIVAHRGPVRSLQRLASQADAISDGDLAVEIEDEGRIDEIGQARTAFRDTKEYIETITEQTEALSRQAFDADVLDAEIPGRVGESMTQMQTDLKRFIDEIDRERERYTTLVEQSSDGVVVVQDAVCVFANDRFVEISGYDRETLTDQRFSELVVSEDREFVTERYEQRLQGESPPDQYEVGIETSDGARRTVELSISRIERDGDPAALVNVRDITERKRRERAVEALQSATGRMQTAESADRVAQIAVDTASDALDLPLSVCWLHGEEPPCLDPAAATDPAREAGLVTTLDPDRYEYEVFERGDAVTDSPDDHTAGTPLQDGILLPLGEHGLLAAGRRDGSSPDEFTLDIAHALAEHTTTALARIERERAVVESERRFRLIAERIDEVIYLATPDFSEVLYVNPAYQDVWGRPAEELYEDATVFLDAVDPRDRASARADFEAMVTDIQQSDHEDSYTFEYRVRRPDGEINWVSATGYSVDLPDGERRFVGIAEDITDRKRREQRLEVFNRVLRHNLRNQLDVIKSHAEVLADQSERDHARRILASTEKLDAIGGRARTIDRIMSRDCQPSTVDVPGVLDRVLAESHTADSAVSVSTECPEPMMLRTDEWVLRMVLESTLENAIRYADSAVSVTVTEQRDGCTIVVEDDGPGIPADELAALDAGTETKLQHSRGLLDLWQIKWGVDKLNGELSFDTTDGTTVRITVPDLQASDQID
jgi:PAS domain S-box-containing protein